MSTPSSILRLELIGNGEQPGTWGSSTNVNLGTLIEGAIAGYTTVSVTSANQALTANNYSADQSRLAMLRLTTTTTANFAVYAPPVSKQYTIYNNTSYVATIYNSTVLGNTTAAGAGVAIPAGKTMTVWSDGTNFSVQNSHLIGTVTGDVTGNLTGNVTGNLTGTASAIADGAVSTAAKLASGVVTADKIASDAVTTAKILNANVTAAKLASGAAVSNIGTGGITSNELAANSVTTAKIADGVVTPTKLSQPLTAGTAVASTSGSSVSFTGIPSWVNRVTVMLNAVSPSTSSINILLRLGTSGGLETSGYVGTDTVTSGFYLVTANGQLDVVRGFVQLVRVDGNIWLESHNLSIYDSANASYGVVSRAGSKTLSGALTQLAVVTSAGTFDAGSINILYE